MYNLQPTSSDKDQIIDAVGLENINTLNPHELEQTEK